MKFIENSKAAMQTPPTADRKECKSINRFNRFDTEKKTTPENVFKPFLPTAFCALV